MKQIEENEILIENDIIKEKEFKIISDKKNEYNCKLFITNDDLFCINLITTINFQSIKYSLSFTMNDLIKSRFFKIFIDLDEVFKELENKINKSSIIEDSNIIYLDIPIGLNVINDILLEIKQTKKSNEEIIKELTNKINHQQNLIQQKDFKINKIIKFIIEISKND